MKDWMKKCKNKIKGYTDKTLTFVCTCGNESQVKRLRAAKKIRSSKSGFIFCSTSCSNSYRAKKLKEVEPPVVVEKKFIKEKKEVKQFIKPWKPEPRPTVTSKTTLTSDNITAQEYFDSMDLVEYDNLPSTYNFKPRDIDYYDNKGLKQL